MKFSAYLLRSNAGFLFYLAQRKSGLRKSCFYSFAVKIYVFNSNFKLAAFRDSYTVLKSHIEFTL